MPFTSKRVYVQGLDNRITENTIKVLFGKFGRIRKISCTENGICSVDFDDYRDANNACAQMNGQDLLGARLTVLPSSLCPYLNKQLPITIDLTEEENNNEEPEKSPPIKHTNLHEAAENGNLSAFKSIIENMLSADIVNTEDFNPEDGEGQTPFHLAAKNGHGEICRLIMANIVDKNPVNHNGETPSQLAALHGHLSVMELITSALRKRVN